MKLTPSQIDYRNRQRTFTSVPNGYRLREIGEVTSQETDLKWMNNQWQPLCSQITVKCLWVATPIKSPQMEWMPVSVKPSMESDSAFTLVKVSGWTRYGFARYLWGSQEWTLSTDPVVFGPIGEVTHWLKIPELS